MYYCTDCSLTFDGFAQAHNHELDTNYLHITMNTEYDVTLQELVVCSHDRQIVHAGEALWVNDDPYCSRACKTEATKHHLVGFYERFR